MENGAIVDSDITASSSFDSGNVGPQNGRYVSFFGVNILNPKHAVKQKLSNSFKSYIFINIETYYEYAISHRTC